ncbi:flagellar assembly protein FliH [Campylobacter sp. US33a]|uniref:Flagellar assembly protein FliH n=1 Tax=Campylobacter sp. CCS1377 TaxID=3158229 RepID=A0AAU7E8X1_9BACT|nr:flagellar assembly protein FliH [Campylobacter sp. US33a]MCW1360567.1 flagellar assembly protein FliH [Campylobacter jejuni]TEY04647.1 flagellar assembly protein FliH [Campylobacter sp. US33a]
MIKHTNVISQNNSNKHVIEGYRFKVMSEFVSEQEKQQEKQKIEENTQQQPILQQEQNEQEAQQQNVTAKEESAFAPSFVEDLLKKTDEMSENIIKLQMQIESQESEFSNRLNAELENAKEKFTKEGYEQAKAEYEKELSELKDKYLKSVAKLNEACVNLDAFVQKNEQELADAALDIAKEVILKELEENSSKIAFALAKDLITELKGASAIELKVNSSDYEFLKAQFEQNSQIKITLDDAISKGSVIVLSDVGNIESNLNNRLAKIKQMVSQ